MLHYFAYGSNMSRRRLKARIGSARYVGRATLHDHALVFHKVSVNDGSGKCDVVACPGERVHGVVYQFERTHQPVLDRIEGAGLGYRVTEFQVELPDAERLAVLSYVATLIDPRLKPFDWYTWHVLEGARDAGLPDDYLARIEAWPTIRDPDPEREAMERSIYD